MRSQRPARVLAYARVSGREQGERGTSLDAQRERIESWCRERGYPPPALRVEVESASAERHERRVELAALLAEARPGDLILTCHVDRWSRDLPWGVASVRDLVRRGVDWYAIGEGIDASEPQGDSTLGLMSWVADQERRRIRERTVGRRAELRDQGLYVEGPAPFGYRRGPRAEKRQLQLDPYPPEVALLVEACERCVAGHSLSRIAAWLEGATSERWDKEAVQKVIRSRTSLGEVVDSRGSWIRGQHPPILDRALWQRAQEALSSRRNSGRQPTDEARTAGWLLRGLATCAVCGARIGAAYSRTEGSGGYYACGRRLRGGGGAACALPYASVALTDVAVAGLALGRLIELRALLAAPGHHAAAAAPAQDHEARRARIEAARARAERGYVEGLLDAAALRRERERLDEELGRLEVAADAARRAQALAAPAARRQLLGDVAVLAGAWERADVATRRTILCVLAERVAIGADGPQISWRSAESLSAGGVVAHLSGGTPGR